MESNQPDQPHVCLECRQRSHIFDYLTEEELIRIGSARYPLSYNPGELIIKEGAPSTYVLSFTAGLAKIIVNGDSEANMIVKLVKPVEFISGPGLFVDSRHYFTIIALEKSNICAIESDVFKEILRNNHLFNEAYLTHVNQNYLLVLQKLLSSFRKNTKGRVAEVLMHLANDVYGAQAFNLTFPITDLASLAGMSKESAFRCIKEFSNDDIIRICKKRIEVLNYALLEEISIKG